MPNYQHKKYKTIINRLKYIDSWFWCRYTTNLYSGCQHACIYCDARSQRYYLHEDFEETIIIKEKPEIVFENQVKNSKKFIPDIIGTAGVCDAYQPAEKIYKNTLNLLKILYKYKFPTFVITKSDLVLRDLEILNRISIQNWCSVAFTITTTDINLANFLEAGASPPKDRFNALKIIHEKYPNIQTGVMFMPIIPFLEDSEVQMEDVIKKSKESGADFILFSPGLTIRDNQKDFFIKKLKQKHPEIVESLLSLYTDNSISPNKNYILEKSQILVSLCDKYKINYRVKRWIPNDYRKLNYEISEDLLNLAYQRQLNGKNAFRLQKAGLEIQNLSTSIFNIYKKDKLKNMKFITPSLFKYIKPKILDFENKNSLDFYF